MKSTILLITAILLTVGSLIHFVYLHESAHQEIYKSYGISSKINLLSLENNGAYTLAEKECPDESCILAHKINDDIGYHMLPIFALIAGLGLVIIAFQYLQLKQWGNICNGGK